MTEKKSREKSKLLKTINIVIIVVIVCIILMFIGIVKGILDSDKYVLEQEKKKKIDIPNVVGLTY